MIQEGKIYQRQVDGILRKVIRLVVDPAHAGGIRVEFEYWNPIRPKQCKETGSCGLKYFVEFTEKEIRQNQISIGV